MARHVRRQIMVCTLLTLVPACSGAASDNGAGNQANAVVVNAAVPAPAAANAVDSEAATNTATTAAPYHANGTEPFWALTIAGGQMTYQPMEGQAVTEPLPEQTPIANGYRYAGDRLIVEIVSTACNNGMSDETFADTVRVSVNGETRNGCGGEGDGRH